MSVTVVKSSLEPQFGREKIVLVDDYGTVQHTYIQIKDAAFRQVKLDALTKTMEANQAALESYAAAHNIDLTSFKKAGDATKAALAAGG